MDEDRGRRARATGGNTLGGVIEAPGDKSISHRALIFGAMADGETRIAGLLEGHDVLRTAAAMRAFGAEIERDLAEGGPVWRVVGRAEWKQPGGPVYFGNSGTGCRLVMGAAAGRGVAAAFDGDASLRSRPMRRITAPLEDMGAAFTTNDGRLPAQLAASGLRGIRYRLPVASAQIKSAVLLAGLGARGETVVFEPEPCRDHTERMLAAFGCPQQIKEAGGVREIRVSGGAALTPASIEVPGDPSSAAFIVAAAVITPGSDVTVRGVLMNPLRTGFFDTLTEMGARLEMENLRMVNGEPVADLRARHSTLRGVETPSERAPSMIDEYPVLAVVAAFAEGESVLRGLAELRVKESDRLAAIEAGLAANGVAVETGEDWIKITGGGDPAGGALVRTHADHRIAMSFLVMGLAARRPVEIDDASMIATSFPGFFGLMNRIGADIASR
ncbi:MAG: 3-phosphoshikimate 1-carboxyvinyltransferase [Parvularculaceae bacterium]